MSYQETMYHERIIGEIKGIIETYFEFGKTIEETIAAVISKFTLTREEAEEYVKKYRPAT